MKTYFSEARKMEELNNNSKFLGGKKNHTLIKSNEQQINILITLAILFKCVFKMYSLLQSN